MSDVNDVMNVQKQNTAVTNMYMYVYVCRRIFLTNRWRRNDKKNTSHFGIINMHVVMKDNTTQA